MFALPDAANESNLPGTEILSIHAATGHAKSSDPDQRCGGGCCIFTW
jgi:hypothetical protein